MLAVCALLAAACLAAPAAAPADGAAPPSPPPRPPARTLAVPILEYHRVGPVRRAEPALTRRLTVAPRAFAAQMRWLRRRGFHAITQERLFAALEWGAPLPPRPVLITFDDGYRDVLWHAAPVLRRLRMPATAYVITGRVSAGDPSFLTWGQLRRLGADGFEIGSHTVSHRDLTTLGPAAVRRELVRSREALLRHLGVAPDWLSYPAGAEDAAVVRAARRAGYLLAVTTRPGTHQSARRPLLLRRLEILRGAGVARLATLLHSRS